MKKSLFISILALLFSAAALVKVFYPCQKAEENKAPESKAETAVAAADIEAVLNEQPEILINAMQNYHEKMQEQALEAATQQAASWLKTTSKKSTTIRTRLSSATKTRKSSLWNSLTMPAASATDCSPN